MSSAPAEASAAPRNSACRPSVRDRSTPAFASAAGPARVVSAAGYERWEGCGALGYLVLRAICDAQLASPPERARVVVAADCFPTGMLGYWVRRLAGAGLAAMLTATSPRRLAHPDGRPVVADVSMGAVTHGDVIAGLARPEQLVPFGGEQAYKAFALALGLQLLVDALAGDGYGAVLVAARPEADPVPALRERAAGIRLPGDA